MNPFPRFLAVLVALSAAACDNATHPMNAVASLEVAPGGPTVQVGDTLRLTATAATAQGQPLTSGSSFRVGRDCDGGWEHSLRLRERTELGPLIKHPRRSVAPRLASGATAPQVQLAVIRTR